MCYLREMPIVSSIGALFDDFHEMKIAATTTKINQGDHTPVSSHCEAVCRVSANTNLFTYAFAVVEILWWAETHLNLPNYVQATFASKENRQR